MIIKIPFKTPTVNLMYATFHGHRVKSKEARELSKKIEEIVKDNFEQIEGKLTVLIEIYSNWYNKDGTIKKRDIANLEKFITDSVFNALPEMDDRQIFKIELRKIQLNKEYTIVTIGEYNGK